MQPTDAGLDLVNMSEHKCILPVQFTLTLFNAYFYPTVNLQKRIILQHICKIINYLDRTFEV